MAASRNATVTANTGSLLQQTPIIRAAIRLLPIDVIGFFVTLFLNTAKIRDLFGAGMVL